ncbi:hypothetical protein [Bdellovibrio bacteriovorus]|uniref:Uncharacterized protein n=1 Tax=Bdellovibrio bacteriovorus str. Tiberius TaxID=1069642 RepID=K7YZI8_BDEBC|nr:hypothetical protein [Bdellovibrio bacteriovorus]AFY03173.1 hypothetical protein Bdt_3498 [Bdellovibrio bacteriovorus str. Tiberius]
MKMTMKSALIAWAALMAVHCTHKEMREPASEKKYTISDGQTQALADLIGGDSPLKPYRHPMKISFHTNGDQKYLSETARKALNQAIIETLGVENPEQGLAKLAAGNLKDAMIENFVKTMRVYKIINTGLQVDLTFLPQPNQRNDYAAELNSNQLVRFNETGALSSKWEQLEKATDTGTVYNNSVLIPATQGQADYIGGTVTFYVEILDTRPKFGLPSIKKNGVKGFARYRRYYRLNREVQKSVSCEGYTLSAKKSGPGVPLFYTVDLYKNFSLKNIIPTEETIEVFPGLVASNNEGRNELMPDKYEKTGKSIPTGQFVVESKKSFTEEISFNLEKIVYDLKEKKLDRDRSRVKLVNYYSSRDQDSTANETQALYSARIQYLKKCESSMEKFLNLDALVNGGVL